MITKKMAPDIAHGMAWVWKCYKCNLCFKDEAHAHMHKAVTDHSVAKIQLPVV